MRWHTKCSTPIQKGARKVLRCAIRALEIAKSVDLAKVNAVTAFNVKRDIDTMQRIVDAFDRAHTDAELMVALHFARQFDLDLDDDERRASH
jgi:hypothetical protein